jgi:hypothetical protein
MRILTALTASAAVAFMGAAYAQDVDSSSGADTGAVAEQTAELTQTQAPAQVDPIATAIDDYAAFQSDVTDLRASRIDSEQALDAAIEMASRHNRDVLSRGWIAYGAMTAAQSQAFVEGVRQTAATYGRDETIAAIAANANYASGMPGAQEAARLALDSADADGGRVMSVADRYLEMSYSLQQQAWAREVAARQHERIAHVRALSGPNAPAPALTADFESRLAVTPATYSPDVEASAFGGRRFWDAVRGGPQVIEVAAHASHQWQANPARAEAVNHMTSLAALSVLDATSVQASAVSQLLNDRRSRDCIEMAHLQLYQCMSAAHFRYENAFCVGQHALKDVGVCIRDVAEPVIAPMTPLQASNGQP